MRLRPGPLERIVTTAASPHVVVVGGGITGLTAAYRLHASGIRVTLLEAGDRLGGKVRTEHRDGFVVEGGADTLVLAKPAITRLVDELGLTARMQSTDDATRRTYVVRRGRLRPLPEGLTGLVPQKVGPIATTRLLSPAGKARMALELAVPPRADDGDESVADFTSRRLGREAYERLVEPLVSGVFAADGAALSVLAALPQLRADEAAYGGLLRAVLARRRETARSRRPAVALGAPARGMAELPSALGVQLAGADVRTGTPVRSVSPAGGRWSVVTPGGVLDADAVVLAVPAPVAAGITTGVDDDLSSRLGSFPVASTASVTLAYRRDDVPHPLDGHGYLVPRAEGRAVRACTWSSVKFAGRAPDGHVLLRVVPDARASRLVHEGSDDELVAVAREELGEMLGVQASPLATWVQRWLDVMPQYTVGHPRRVAELRERLTRWPGLLVAGSAYDGMSVPDCVASGERAAEAVLARIAARHAANVPGRG